MTDASQAAEVAALKARIAALEGSPRAPRSANPAARRVGLLLLLGILLVPYIFVWLLLRQGYSRTARIVGFGWLVCLVAILVISDARQNGSTTAPTNAPVPIDPHAHEKGIAAEAAKLEVPKFMKDPDSARFGQVWGMSTNIACGYVNGKNSFGAMTGEQRFIFAEGQAEFEDHSSRFAKQWNTLCIDKLLSAPPTEAGGKRWGSAPTADLKIFSPATAEGLSLYVPKNTPAALEGVPVKEADYQYDRRRLYAVDLYIDGEPNREAIKAALVKRYGTPLEYDEGSNRYKWSWPKRHVSVEMTYQDSSKRTTVTFAQGAR